MTGRCSIHSACTRILQCIRLKWSVGVGRHKGDRSLQHSLACASVRHTDNVICSASKFSCSSRSKLRGIKATGRLRHLHFILGMFALHRVQLGRALKKKENNHSEKSWSAQHANFIEPGVNAVGIGSSNLAPGASLRWQHPCSLDMTRLSGGQWRLNS